ncbi:hypothetical protein ONZ43_g6421 [Nemania bipapillata]|uniref:Uncharacterized protein n=1 Tax=Nemania bipapillata TaxID=110536 RepID=A0ACC2I0G5_9PEZI|nr:hypothetical protein ONZ43_g6421 [Nemania bipapillata]
MSADNRGPELAAVTGFLLGLSAVTVFLRCYVRIFMLKLFRPEDWLAVWTLALSIAYTAFVMLSIGNGAGSRQAAVPIENIPKVLEMRWAGELTYIVTGISLKLTVGLFLLRICGRKWQKIAIYTVLIVCIGFNSFYLFIAVFQCRPVEFYWEQYTNATINGRCLSSKLITSLTYAACAVNAAGDWVLGLLPIALVRGLDLAKRQKISIAAILALGALASTATIVRIFYVWELTQDGDILYTFTDLAIWSTVENGLGLTASSIATLRPLFKSFREIPLSQRLSTSWHALRKQSRNTNSYGPDLGPNAGGQFYGLEPQAPRRAIWRQPSDDSIVSEGGVSLTPSKYSWQSYRSYELNKNVLERHYYPVSPREMRTRWYSDGSRQCRIGGRSRENQQARGQGRELGNGHRVI